MSLRRRKLKLFVSVRLNGFQSAECKMIKVSRLTAVIAMCFLLTDRGMAQPAADPPITLHLGDPAPPLSMSSFIKGQPVTTFEKGKSYVVEFWATWCGPCRVTIPHLSRMQEKYKDITFIGQDCWENDIADVKPFMAEMGSKMNYRVALDDTSGPGRGKMADSWLTAAGQDGIPIAFLVDGGGKIVFIGHPLELEDVLPQYVAGTFDAKTAEARHAALQVFSKDLNAAVVARDYDKAIVLVDQFAKDHHGFADQLTGTKYTLLLRKKDFPSALALARQLFDSVGDNVGLCNEIAWSMVDPEVPFDKPDLDLALKYAQHAAELAKDDPSVMDTLAHVYAARGDFPKAIEFETTAVAKANGPEKEQLQKSLDGFKAKGASGK
jgi:thiol-disulfide isomerase/thioredoxin